VPLLILVAAYPFLCGLSGEKCYRFTRHPQLQLK